MNDSLPFLLAFIGMLACGVAIPLICRRDGTYRWQKRNRELHHTHGRRVPRFGGLGLAIGLGAVTLGIFLALPLGMDMGEFTAIVCGAGAMFGLGFWDDVRPLRARTKLLGQILIASGMYCAGVQIDVVKNPFTLEAVSLGVFGYFATVLWLVTLTNLINITDGIDGLAGGISLMLMCLLAAVGLSMGNTFPSLLAAGMGGALIGFLYHNFPPAKIHMGDGGAYLLGFLIGALSLVNSHKGTVLGALVAPMLALALPISDVILAILRRSLQGLPIFRPDRKHIHHRLLDFGLSRRAAVLLLYGLSGCCLLFALGVFWLEDRLWPLLVGAISVVLLGAGRTFGWFKGWHGLGTASLVRQESRYALLLSEWLQMEAERCASVQGLWEDYQFIAGKLGFAEVRLSLKDGSQLWQADPKSIAPGPLRRVSCPLEGGMILEFGARPTRKPEAHFQLSIELAAEIWFKAALRWQHLNQIPLEFASIKRPPAGVAEGAAASERGTSPPPSSWHDEEEGFASSTIP